LKVCPVQDEIKEEAVNSKCKPWAILAVVALLLVFASGCASTSQAASGEQEGKDLAQAGDAPGLWSHAVFQGNALLHFSPSPQQVPLGGTASVQLRLENVNNLYGIEAHLIFDASLVQVEDDDPEWNGVQIAPGEIPNPEFTVQNAVDNSVGRLDYAVVQLAPRPPASGSGVVATIRFRGVRKGSGSIRFSSAKLASPDGEEIAVTLQEGAIVVVSAPLPTTPAPTTQPTTTPPAPTAITSTPSPASATATPLPTPSPTASPVPPPVAAPAISQCPALYVVRTKDTAFSIARRFGISLDVLAAANKLSPPSAIEIGQLLVIPGVPGPTASSHVVQAGDTLYSIARRYGTSVETIAALNQTPHPWHARLGQKLLLCPP
jgi:LysM repeat protein